MGRICGSPTGLTFLALCLLDSSASLIPLRFANRPDLLDAMACGADVSVQSTHKTLSSLSQTAMLHINEHAYQAGDDSLAIEEIVGIHDSLFSTLTTTSPNSILLASLDAARSQCAVSGGSIAASAEMVEALREEIRCTLQGAVELLDDSDDILPRRKGGLVVIDPLRLCVRFEGYELATDIDDELCSSRQIYCELNEEACITYAVPSYISCENSSLVVLSRALLGLTAGSSVKELAVLGDSPAEMHPTELSLLDCKMSSISTPVQQVVLDLSLVGRVAAETVCSYPPGVPVLLRGERIRSHHVAEISRLRNDGVRLGGSGRFLLACSDKTLATLSVYVKQKHGCLPAHDE